jgi:hypothetical protein
VPQSSFDLQWRRTSQGLHEPPQSTSVSVPFATPSSHAGASHAPSLHTPLAQSPE